MKEEGKAGAGLTRTRVSEQRKVSTCMFFFTLIELGKFGNDMEVNYVTLSFIWNKHMRIANAHEEF